MGGITTIINKVKYIGIASLTIAILSVLILNLISSYSSSNIESNAEPVGDMSTLANIDPAGISISISSYPSATGDTNDGNLSLSIPQGGGLVAGRHTVTVGPGSDISYYSLYLNGGDEDGNTDLVNDADNASTISSIQFIDLATPNTLNNNSWGVALPFTNTPGFNDEQVYEQLVNNPVPSSHFIGYNFVGIPSRIREQYETMIDGRTFSSLQQPSPISRNIYYGVRVDHPEQLLAGNYTAQVVYSVTAKLQEPVLTSIEPSTYELGSNDSNTITITGKYLSTASKVYLTNTDTSANNASTQYDCTNLQLLSNDANGNTTLTCNIPTDTTNPAIDDPGTYSLTIETEGGTTTKEDAITYTKPSICRNNDPDSDCQVDIDDNMIPVTYDEERQVWIALNEQQINSLTGIWYDYGAKKWANAVTVQNPNDYRESKDVDESDILGYWVYIPRYAYQVQRKEVRDHYVSDILASNNGGFNIRFETASDFKKEPVETCSTENSNMFYTDMNGMENEPNYVGSCHTRTDYPTREEDYNQTAWATHPAFTWKYTKDINGFDQTTELNGFWVGKFETTGSSSSPTILPNQYHLYRGAIGDYYDISQSIGIEDKNNTYGNSAQTSYNGGKGYHNLAISTSHMLKNSEWGAVAYLASSKYGAGINNVQLNNSYGSGGTGKGPSGGVYNTDDGQKASTTNKIYGVYDMAGGAYEYVMGGYTNNASQSMTNYYLSIAVKPPYVDLYPNTVFTNNNYLTNNNQCTWATCGGHALYETKNVQSVSSSNQSWGGGSVSFVDSVAPLFDRGGYAGDGFGAGLFYSNGNSGGVSNYYGFRAALLVMP